MIYTFYSYKGGVGRSMAMAGIAHLLARRGLRVLAIDFDLEAPGLERYFFDAERCKSVRAQRGLIDLIKAYRLALSSPDAFEQAEFKRWQQFKLTAIHVAGSLGGSVDLMTAGQREPETAMRDYALAVRSFDWQDFFHNWKGDLFFDWLRRQLRDAATGYDVVLVDSRTGVTEMGGVCAYQLADVAVLLCAPNYQNLEGTRDVARDFRSDAVLGLRQGRPLEIVAVPARVEANHPKRAQFLEDFARELGVEGLPKALAEAGLTYETLALPYLPQFAVAERLVGEPQSEPDRAAPPIEVFERLADALTLLAQPQTKLHALRADALQRLAGGSTALATALVADTTKSSAGYDVFLDHSRADTQIAAQLVASIERLNFRAIAASTESEPGDRLSTAHDQALDYSQALFVCFGRPTHTEARARLIARARRLQSIRIVPVLLPGADPAALASFDLSEQQAVDLRGWPDAHSVEQLERALVAAMIVEGTAAQRNTAIPERDPYPGARPYGEDDAAWFFGRAAVVAHLCRALEALDVLWIGGAAQIGKTSLVRAGLLPALRAAASKGQRLAAVLWLDCDAAPPTMLDELAGNRWEAPRDAAPFNLVVIDGVDTFSQDGRSAARSQRIAQIAAAVQRAAGRYGKFVLIGRDVLPEDQRRELLAAVGSQRFLRFELAPLAGAHLREAIEEPAKKAGHLLEPGLAERLVESAGGAANSIAQIQLALAAIWPERRRGWLTNKNLDAAGHLGGIVAQRRIAALAALDEPRRAAARVLFGRLVKLSGNYELVAAPQPWEPLASIALIEAGDAVALRDGLASAAVIDLARVALADASSPRFEVQVALARPDPAVYFGEGGAPVDVRFLIWRDPLALQALRWRAGSDALLRGSALVEAQDWLARAHDQLTADEAQFIGESGAAHERQVAAEKSREDAERNAREARERERREAAEALAAEQGARLRVETAALARAKGGLRWVIGLAVVALAMFGVAVMQSLGEREARKAAQRNAERALDEAARARAEAELANVQSRRAAQAAAAADEALKAARLANDATAVALAARSDASRQQAKVLYETAQGKVNDANDDVRKLQVDCPVGRRVYLHIADDAERAAARQVIPLLQRQGYIVPGIELVRQVPPVTDVRYFRAADEAGAGDALKTLRGIGIADATPKLIAGFEKSTNIRPCHYEVWFASGALPAK